jgi:hypothetical protein
MLGFDTPIPDAVSFIGYREKPRPDAGNDEGGTPVRNPRTPQPRIDSTTAEEDFDWT